MAYPMIPWPTFAEFRTRLVGEFGCKYKQLEAAKISINGEAAEPVYYLERKVGDDVRRYSVNIPDDERVAPSVIRSVCRRLDVDAAAFGLTLG